MGLDILLRGVALLVMNFFFQYHFIAIETTWLYWLLQHGILRNG
ncbi:MAG: hypothetical protein ACLGGV_00825 [Bacteroidia bacterium]